MSKSMQRSAFLASILSVTFAQSAFAAPPKKPVAPDAPADAKPADAKPADAKPEDPKALEAQKHFKNGLELFKLHSHDASLAEFEKAYTLSNNYKILFNIALVYRDMNNFAGAVDMFDRYFTEGGADIDAFRRAEVEAEYNRLAVYVAQLTVTANVEGADILIDDYPVGKTPLEKPLRVNAGTRRKVTLQAENAPPISKYVKVAGGEKVTVTFDAHEKAVANDPEASAAIAKPLPPPEDKPSKFTKLSWIGLGAAGALAIGATVTGVVALGASSDLKKGLFVGATPSDDLESSRSTARALSITTDVLIVAAAATAGVTLYLTLSHQPKSKTATTQLGFKVAGAGGALVGTF